MGESNKLRVSHTKTSKKETITGEDAGWAGRGEPLWLKE
jgi:hypothetical protein